MAFVIFIRDQNSDLTCHVCNKTSATIGRAPDNDIVLFDGSVSKRHCQVSSSGGVLIAVDLNSSNGVIVNDEKITAATVVGAEDQVRIRGFTMMMRMLTVDEQVRYEAGLDPQCAVPSQLASRQATQDLESRLGVTSQSVVTGAKAPVSLDSIYRAFNEGEQEVKSANEEIGAAPQSLNSIFHAVASSDEPTLNDRAEIPSSLNSIFEAVTPPPSVASPDKPHEPKSLNSIFNAVNPLSDELLKAPSPSGNEQSLAEEPLIGSIPLAAEKPKADLNSSLSPSSASEPKSLNSIFNAVNPLSDDVLKTSASGEKAKREPKSLNSVFNAVNPIPDELLGKSLESELIEAHAKIEEKVEQPKDKKSEPKSLNSIFNAVNPLADFLEAKKNEEG